MANAFADINQSLFHVTDPLRTFISSDNSESLETLIAGIRERKKFFLVTGQQGSGKTTFIQRAVCELGSKTRLINLHRGALDFQELVDFIGHDLDSSFSLDAPLKDKLSRLGKLLEMWSLQHLVIVIDQSLNIQQQLLENLIKLSNTEISDQCCPHLIFVGLPKFEEKLLAAGLPAEVLEGALSLQIEPLSEDEVVAYINFHLQNLKNQGRHLFSDDAIKRIVHYSKGLPRLINRLCSLALLTAKLEEKSTVKPEMIEEILQNSLLLGKECGYVANKPIEIGESEALVEQELLAESKLIAPKPEVKGKEPVSETDRYIKFSDAMGKEVSDEEKDGSPEENDFASDNKKIPNEPIKELETVSEEAKRNISIFSNQTSTFITAFIMGMIFSALIGAVLYFMQQTSEVMPENKIEIAKAEQNQNYEKIKQKKIAALLERSEQQFAKQQLMTPGHDNAWESYRKVLDLEPGHPKALAGIEKIKDTLVLWAKQEIKQENYQQAAYHYRKALEASPNDQGIVEALRDIDKKELSKKTVEVPVVKIAVTDNEKYQIEQLLKKADRQLSEKKLMTPDEDSAWSSYKKILALDPEHLPAREGIEKIKETYKLWARNEIKKGNFNHAAFLLRKALQISPDDSDIQEIVAKIEAGSSTTASSSVQQIHRANRKNALSRRDFYELLKDPYGVDELLAFAKQQIARKRLTKPESDSAFTIYKIILERYPTHQKALAGIKKIKDTYLLWARHEMKKGNIDKAELLYSKALEVAPGDLNIMSTLKNQFKKSKPTSPPPRN